MRRFLVATASLSFLLAPNAVFIDSTKAHGCDSRQVGCGKVGEYPPPEQKEKPHIIRLFIIMAVGNVTVSLQLNAVIVIEVQGKVKMVLT